MSSMLLGTNRGQLQKKKKPEGFSKNEVAGPKWKQHSVVDMSGGESKVWCCKEQYCIGTWNVRSMNQGKLKVVREEMARVNIDILGISELKWMGMGEFNSDDKGIFPTQGLNPDLVHCRWLLYYLSHQGIPGEELRAIY